MYTAVLAEKPFADTNIQDSILQYNCTFRIHSQHTHKTGRTLTSLVERTCVPRTSFCSLLDLPCTGSPTKSPIGPAPQGGCDDKLDMVLQEPAERKKPTTE